MNATSLVRFLICVLIAASLMAFLLPRAGIPRSRMIPPALAYSAAQGKTLGVITRRYTEPSSNPFRVGENIYLIDYQFTARASGAKSSGATQTYRNTIRVGQTGYGAAREGLPVPIRYEPTSPQINGIDLPEGGRGIHGASAFFSLWLLFPPVVLIAGYVLAQLLDNLLHRGY